ncbi:MAG: hypothetical protein LBG92_00135 [Prevotellaceae bacterium]|nr:hypothetical protein [Prevotellaceae bacterium]
MKRDFQRKASVGAISCQRHTTTCENDKSNRRRALSLACGFCQRTARVLPIRASSALSHCRRQRYRSPAVMKIKPIRAKKTFSTPDLHK